MTNLLEGLTVEEECTIMIALKAEMLKFQRLLEETEYWFFKEKIATLYSIFNKMGFDRQAVDRYIKYDTKATGL